MQSTKRSGLFAMLLSALLIACSSHSAGEPAMPPGTLHVAPDGAVIDYATLRARLADVDVIYLGEQHGNPHHHAAQLRILADLVRAGRKPALGLEIVSLVGTSDLMGFVAASSEHGDPAKRLRDVLGWDERGNHWRDYGPLIEFAREHKLRIAGIDLVEGLRRRISRVGVDGLSAVERMQLYDTRFVDAAYEAAMRERLDKAHCGFASAETIGRLYETWLARNDAMAEVVTRLAAEQPGEPVVVIVGGGHVANDMGVFERVAHRAPHLRQLNLGFVAERPGRTPQDEFTQAERAGRRFAPPHQIVWLTPGSAKEAESPCGSLEERMKKLDK